MKDTYEMLIKRLESFLQASPGSNSSKGLFSPITGGESSDSPPFITSDINLGNYSKEHLFMIHTTLHFLYSMGGNKDMKKKDIEKLHREIKEKIPHQYFDGLDNIENV